jgi:hypothetical protein
MAVSATAMKRKQPAKEWMTCKRVRYKLVKVEGFYSCR